MGCREQGISTKLLHRPAVVDEREVCGRRVAPVTRGAAEGGHMCMGIWAWARAWVWGLGMRVCMACTCTVMCMCMCNVHCAGSHGPTHVAAFLVACLPAPGGRRRCQRAPQCLQGRRSGRRWGTARCSNPGPSKHAGARAPWSTTPSSLPGSCEDDAAKRRAARPHVRARAVLARQVSRRA